MTRAATVESVGDWTTPFVIVWNVAATALWGCAAVAVFLPKSRPLRGGWLNTMLWLIPLFLSVSYRSLFVPIGPIVLLLALRKGWREEAAMVQHDEQIAPAA